MSSNHYALDLINSGRIEDAGRYLTKTLADHPDSELMNVLGNSYLLRGEVDEAERCFRQSVGVDPRNFAPA